MERTFERRFTFSKWDGTYRDTEISFNAGGKLGRFTRKFERYQVKMIEFKNEKWYLALTDTSGTPPKRIVSEQIPILILNPNGVEQAARSWDEVPDFPQQNVMPLTPSEVIVQQFSGTLLTWERKIAHWQKYPRAAGDNGKIIQRHTKP